MSIRDDLQKHLSPELYQQVVDALGDDFIYDQVPRTRLNRVIQQRDDARSAEATLREQLAGFTQQPNGGTGKSTTGGEPPKGNQPVDVEALTAQLQAQFQQQQDQAIKDIKVKYAGLDALRGAGCVDPELAWSLIDKSKLDIDASDKLTGIDEQIASMKEARAFLYGTSGSGGVPSGTGKTGGQSDPGATISKKDFLAMSTADQLKFKETNPEQFRQFMQF